MAFKEQMTAEQAVYLLGLDGAPSSNAGIKAAFAKRVREIHPDTAKDAPNDVAEQIAELRAARDLLLGLIADKTIPAVRRCKLCNGSGRVRRTRGPAVDCTQCKGEGII